VTAITQLAVARTLQRFGDASTIGWRHYLYGDNSKANELMRRDNPDIHNAFLDRDFRENGS
jgi:hypothetical protein